MCVCFPRCVGRRERLFSPWLHLECRVLSDKTPRGWTRLGERMIRSQRDLDPTHSEAHSTENPAHDRLRTLAHGTLPTGPWAPLGLCSSPHITPHRHQPCSQSSVPALTVVKTSIGRWMGTLRKQLESGGVWERPRTGA